MSEHPKTAYLRCARCAINLQATYAEWGCLIPDGENAPHCQVCHSPLQQIVPVPKTKVDHHVSLKRRPGLLTVDVATGVPERKLDEETFIGITKTITTRFPGFMAEDPIEEPVEKVLHELEK